MIQIQPDLFRVAVDAVAGDDILLDLDRVAHLLHLPTREAVRYRIHRGTLQLRTVQPGGRSAELLVPTADVYEVLGLTWTPPSVNATVLACVLPDGTVALSNNEVAR